MSDLEIIQMCVLCSTLIKLFPFILSWSAVPVVTFTVHFTPSNQPHLAIHLALLSLAELRDCAELPAPPRLILLFCSCKDTGLDMVAD